MFSRRDGRFISGAAGGLARAADVAESCSCDISCPCNFGSAPTHDYCHGNRLYQITEGHYEDIDVSGLEFMVTFSIREWAKLYVSERASDAQMEALQKLTPHILGGFERSGIVVTERVPLVVERSGDKVKFSVPESSVDMDVMKGYGGKPVTAQNLPSATFQHSSARSPLRLPRAALSRGLRPFRAGLAPLAQGEPHFSSPCCTQYKSVETATEAETTCSATPAPRASRRSSRSEARKTDAHSFELFRIAGRIHHDVSRWKKPWPSRGRWPKRSRLATTRAASIAKGWMKTFDRTSSLRGDVSKGDVPCAKWFSRSSLSG